MAHLIEERGLTACAPLAADGTRVAKPDNPHREVDREVFLPGIEPGEAAASPHNPVLYRA